MTAFLTRHSVSFQIGTVDWVAEIEVDGIGYTLQSVSMDVAGKHVGCIEGDELNMHYGYYKGPHSPYGGILSFDRIVAHLMRTRLSDILSKHEDERGQNEIDARMDEGRDRKMEKDMGYE